MLSKLKKLYKNGFFHIFGGSVFSQIGAFIVNILVTRMLPKAMYGTYTATHNMYSYFALFTGLGFVTGIMQYCSEDIGVEKKNLYYKFSLRFGSLANLVIGLVIVGFGLFIGRDNPEKAGMLICMSLLPMTSFFSTFNHSVLRVNKKNKYYAYANVSGVLINVTTNLIVTRLIGVYGIIIATYITQIVNALVSQYFINKHCPKIGDISEILSGDEKKKFVKFSLICCITNLTSSLLILMDITCVDLILKDPEITASYKIASTIPSALMFIPASYITYVYPLLAERNRKPKMLNKLIRESVGMMALINGAISLTLFVSAPFVVDFIWGTKYADAVPCLRLLVVNFFIFGTFRKIFGNVILVLKKVEINFINTLTAGILNIVLNVVLIGLYGSIGAAVATILVSVYTALFSLIYYGFYIKKEKRNSLQEI